VRQVPAGYTHDTLLYVGAGINATLVAWGELLATGGAVIKCPSALNVLEDTYDHSFY
jgi:hypothetical protein